MGERSCQYWGVRRGRETRVVLVWCGVVWGGVDRGGVEGRVGCGWVEIKVVGMVLWVAVVGGWGGLGTWC